MRLSFIFTWPTNIKKIAYILGLLKLEKSFKYKLMTLRLD